jgi:hypothetical protein
LIHQNEREKAYLALSRVVHWLPRKMVLETLLTLTTDTKALEQWRQLLFIISNQENNTIVPGTESE